jgi:hypothetical protein
MEILHKLDDRFLLKKGKAPWGLYLVHLTIILQVK